MHKFVDYNGTVCYLTSLSYHFSLSDIRLFIPKNHNELHGGNSTVHGNNVKIRLKKHLVVIPNKQKYSNIPIVCDSDVFTK